MRPEPGQVLHFSEDPRLPGSSRTSRRPPRCAIRWSGPWTPPAGLGRGRRPLAGLLVPARLPAARCTPIGEPEPHALVCAEPVEPLGPAEPVGSVLQLHEQAGIQLRVLPNLWPFWDAVVASSLGYSGIRLRNARPRDACSHPAP